MRWSPSFRLACSALLLAPLSACIFFVDDANDGAGGATSAASVGGAGGTTSAAGGASQGGGGAGSGAGGGGAGGSAPACTLGLDHAGEVVRQASLMIVGSPSLESTADLYALNPNLWLEALSTDDLPSGALASQLTAAPDLVGAHLSPYFTGGVIVTHQDTPGSDRRVTWMFEQGGAMAELPVVLNPLSASPVREAAARGSTVYGRYDDGGLRVLSAVGAEIAPDGVARLFGDGEHIVWVTVDGAVHRCIGAACTPSVPSTVPIEIVDATLELVYAHATKRFVALARDTAPVLHTGTLPDTPPASDAQLLQLPDVESEDLVDIALSGDVLFVLTTSKLFACCVDSLTGTTPCGAPQEVFDGVMLASLPDRVVVQIHEDAPQQKLVAYDVVR